MDQLLRNFEKSTQQIPLTVILEKAYFSSFSEAKEPTSMLTPCLHLCLKNPGRMVRAKLAYSLCQSFDLTEETSIQIAIAIEYFQTASLLFDDLPNMDNASERRGKPTPHIIFGESKTILAGLALINKAYKMLWDASSVASRPAQQHALDCVDECLGMSGLVGGQSDDLHSIATSGKDALHVANKKTRPLLRLAMELPTTIGGADSRTVQLIRRLSIFWGLAYQISDDFKDILADHSEIGKPAMQDSQLGRPNYVLLEGPPAAINQLKHYVELARTILHQYPSDHPSHQILLKFQQWFEDVTTEWTAKVAAL